MHEKNEEGYAGKADIYSLGMVIYELMALEKPFANVPPTQRWEMSAKGKIPDLSSEQEAKYEPLLKIWKKCIAKDASNRPTAKKLIQKLSALL